MGKTKGKSKDQRLIVAKEMPPLYRTLPNEKYLHSQDEVLKWIARSPGMLNYVFDKMVANGYIFYNPDTGKWQGADYED